MQRDGGVDPGKFEVYLPREKCTTERKHIVLVANLTEDLKMVFPTLVQSVVGPSC